MALSDLLQEKNKVVKIGNTEVTLNPLSVTDISILLTTHAGPMMDLLSGLLGGKVEGASPVSLSTIVTTAPEFIASVIVMADDEGKVDSDDVKSLSFGVQLMLLEAVWEVSIVDAEYLGKLIARLVGGLEEQANKVNKTDKAGRKTKKKAPKVMTLPKSDNPEYGSMTASAQP